MLRKALVFALAFAVLAAFSPALAARPVSAPAAVSLDLPDQAGVYDVPGRPDLKLKVIVYHGKPTDKPGKPGSSAPTEQCGLADGDSSAVTPKDPTDPWYLPNGWTYSLNVGSAPGSIGADVMTVAANSFGEWNDAVPQGAPTINYAGTTMRNKAQRDGESIVSWGRTSGSALATTYIWYSLATNPHPVVEIDMIMNQKFAWEWSDPSTWASKTAAGTTCAFQGVYDAQNIMTHEVGHWFGLDDTYTGPYTNNTMYGYGSKTETKKNSLTTGDVLGLDLIY